MSEDTLTYYEFFAGGGMARMGFGSEWQCLLANDHDPKKVSAYCENWGNDHLVPGDIEKLTAGNLPVSAHVSWASFPCQDLSLAGTKAGLKGGRSGTFWPFWNLMRELKEDGRHPAVIVLENVYGALTSHQGGDFATIADALVQIGYRLGLQVIDAARFVPQSRVRLFILAVRDDLQIRKSLTTDNPSGSPWYPDAAFRSYRGLSDETAGKWVWWDMPVPELPVPRLEALIDESPTGVRWHTSEETKKLLAMMSNVNRGKVELAKSSGLRQVGTVYRRTREGVQRAEVRFDGVAGCLRTPAGGSSRQTIIEIKGRRIRSRLISPREAARLMGLPERYILPPRYNDAYHLLGDGVVVPVVSHLVRNLIEPLIMHNAVALGRAA